MIQGNSRLYGRAMARNLTFGGTSHIARWTGLDNSTSPLPSTFRFAGYQKLQVRPYRNCCSNSAVKRAARSAATVAKRGAPPAAPPASERWLIPTMGKNGNAAAPQVSASAATSLSDATSR